MNNPSDVSEKLQNLLRAQLDEYGRLRDISIQISQFSFIVAALLGIDSIKDSNRLSNWAIAALISLGLLLILVVYISYLNPYAYRRDATDSVVLWFQGKRDLEITESLLVKHLEFELKENFDQLKYKYFAYRFLPYLFSLELLFSIIGLFS